MLTERLSFWLCICVWWPAVALLTIADSFNTRITRVFAVYFLIRCDASCAIPSLWRFVRVLLGDAALSRGKRARCNMQLKLHTFVSVRCRARQAKLRDPQRCAGGVHVVRLSRPRQASRHDARNTCSQAYSVADALHIPAGVAVTRSPRTGVARLRYGLVQALPCMQEGAGADGDCRRL